MPDALDKMRAGADKARSKLAAKRLGGREFDVVVSTFVSGNDQVGTAGTWSPGITLNPRPAVSLKGVFRTLDGAVTRMGDAEVRGISRANYTEAELRGDPGDHPSRWTIGGRSYSLVTLDARPTEWVAILQAEGE